MTQGSLRTGRAKEAVDRIVLGTVNSSWKHVINVDTLVWVIRQPQQANQWLPHVAAFFVEVKPDTVLEFAAHHHVPVGTLKKSYAWVKARTGEHSRALEAEFG
jgi:hypothetical protein